MKRLGQGICMAAALGVLFAAAAGAMVTREEGAKTIAGVLDKDGYTDEYTFNAQAGQILFLDLDGALYRPWAHDGEHDLNLFAEEGGCEDEGGPQQLCVQVLHGEDLLCWAGRPAPPPGWSRDPRLACLIPEADQDYLLRVFWTDVEGGCESGNAADPGAPLPYLLNFSIRNEAPEGRIEPAVGQSRGSY